MNGLKMEENDCKREVKSEKVKSQEEKTRKDMKLKQTITVS